MHSFFIENSKTLTNESIGLPDFLSQQWHIQTNSSFIFLNSLLSIIINKDSGLVSDNINSTP